MKHFVLGIVLGLGGIIALTALLTLLTGCGTTTTGTEAEMSSPQVRIDLSLYPVMPKVEGLTGEQAAQIITAWAKAIEAAADKPLPGALYLHISAIMDRHVSGSQSISSAVEASLQAQIRDLFKPAP